MTEQYPPQEFEDEISLTDIFRTFWRCRVMIIGSLAAVMLLFAIAVTLLFTFLPSRRVATLPFRITFEGAENGKYPNGMKFSTADIITSPILNQVYQANNLQKVLPFEDFKNAVYITQTNKDLEMLDEEYKARLADRKLTAMDRQRIEAEYRQKRKSLHNQQYTLNLSLQEGIISLPEKQVGKVMADILATWATEADQRKGAFKYRIPVYSRNIIQKGMLESEDYIISIDILRAKIKRILDNIKTISELPGAQVARVGRERISLAEISSNLEDTLRFKLEPLVGLIRSTGLSKNPDLAILYLENQLFKLTLDRKETNERMSILRTSLKSYMEKKMVANAMPMPNLGAAGNSNGQTGKAGSPNIPTYIPQFGDSFLDRLMEMTTQGNDVKYRQDITDKIVEEGMKIAAIEKQSSYYKSLIESMRNLTKNKSANNLSKVIELIKSSFADIESDIQVSLDRINEIYQELSKHNLNPQSMLYATTDPVLVKKQRAISRRKLGITGIALLLLTFMTASIVCLTRRKVETTEKSQ